MIYNSKNRSLLQPALHWTLHNPNEPVKHFQASLNRKELKKSGTFAKFSVCGDAAFGQLLSTSFFDAFFKEAEAILTDLVQFFGFQPLATRLSIQ